MIQIVEVVVEVLDSQSVPAEVWFKFRQVNAKAFMTADLAVCLQSEESKSTAQEVALLHRIVPNGMAPYGIELTKKGWWRADWSTPDQRSWLERTSSLFVLGRGLK